MKKPTWLAPYLPSGSIPEWVAPNAEAGISWREPEPFDGTLRILPEIYRGRSAAHFRATIDELPGAEFTIFMVDLMPMIRDRRWHAGILAARFEPCKRGQNFGLRLVGAEK